MQPSSQQRPPLQSCPVLPSAHLSRPPSYNCSSNNNNGHSYSSSSSYNGINNNNNTGHSYSSSISNNGRKVCQVWTPVARSPPPPYASLT